VDVVQPGKPDPMIRQKFGIHPGRFLFLFFGRLGISKGIEVMTEACQLFLTKSHDCQLALVTGEREHKMLQVKLEELQASFPEQVFLLPRMERNVLIGLVTAADCVLMPSRSEGFGLAGVESCTLGKPLVASRGGALKDHLWGRVNFFEPGDVSGMVEGMQRAVKNDFDQYPRQLTFDWQQMISAYAHLIKGLK
jgi:D-inositol-3-phosphate glycosyltransferase